jgi:hypothetical protein
MMDLKPVYGGILIGIGAAVGVLAVIACATRHPAPAFVAGVLAIGAGISLDTVQVVISNQVIYRSYSVFELRGPAAYLAAASCGFAVLVTLALVLAIAAVRARRNDSPR